MEGLKLKKKISLFLLSLVVAVGCIPTTALASSEGIGEVPKLQIPVFSDVHLYNDATEQRFREVLKDYKTLAPNYKAMAIVGDITNYGFEEQYDSFNKILNENINPEAEKIITMGNHEFFEGRFWPRPELTDEVLINRFIKKTEMPGLYYDKWVEGYHFITISSEKSPVSDVNIGDYAIISDEQYEWLEKKLDDNADPKKPIFVFLHQPIDDTVYGSEDWGGGLRDGRLTNLLKQYPQVIFFSGHLHYMLSHPRTVYQDGFTMVNTGAVAYSLYEGGNGPREYMEGLLVNVYDDKVEIKAREFNSDTWVNNYTIKFPFEETINDKENPYFEESSKINIDNINKNQVVITFDAAKDNTLVDKYYIKNNDKIIQTEYIKFWENKQNNKVTVTIDNLFSNTEYNLKIIGVDAWRNQTVTPMEIKFSTPKFQGWVKERGFWYYYDGKTGVKRTGWIYDSGAWYYLDNNGAMKTGWVDISGSKYYMSSNGTMQVGWIKSDDNWYYMSSSGAMQKGWLNYQGAWYYLNSIGQMETGWIKDGTQKYFLKDSGIMATGWMVYEGHWYYLRNNGTLATGWVQSGSTWYYMKSDGTMVTGWMQLGNKWYYFNGNGTMACNVTIDGYKLGKDGAWVR